MEQPAAAVRSQAQGELGKTKEPAQPQIQGRAKWTTLEHRGVAFPPEYQPRGITITIRGEKLMLSRDQEEMVYAWAKKKDTHYVQDPVVQANFLSDLKKLLPEKFRNIASMADLDLSEAYRLADEEKKIKESERERLKATYGKAVVDGVEVDIANWLVEPPGLFMGRGQHPMRGRWKPRVKPENVTLNLGENAPVPEGTWQAIVHDRSSTWLATWMEELTGKRKYVWLHDSSELRQNSDREKYDKARRLARHLGRVQKEIINRMKGSDRSKQQDDRKVATVSYLIF